MKNLSIRLVFGTECITVYCICKLTTNKKSEKSDGKWWKVIKVMKSDEKWWKVMKSDEKGWKVVNCYLHCPNFLSIIYWRICATFSLCHSLRYCACSRPAEPKAQKHRRGRATPISAITLWEENPMRNSDAHLCVHISLRRIVAGLL